MRTTSVYNSLAVMVVVAVVSGCASNRSIQPPFEWDLIGEFATPGTSLTLTELTRARDKHIVFGRDRKVFIYYEIRATGFTPNEHVNMWVKRGKDYHRQGGIVDADGVFRTPGHYEAFGIFDYVAGQPLEVALTTETNDKRAHAKVFPFPIEAHGTNGCSISMSLEDTTGRMWFVTLQGFEPNQPIQIVSQYNDGTKEHSELASDTGELRWFVGFKPPARGTASITATGGDRTASVQYSVGYDAINPTDEQLYLSHYPEIVSLEEGFELLDSLGYGPSNSGGEK